MNFFVIGLPRSRTAWLANFLTCDRLCYHEGLDGCYSIGDYQKKLGENNGDSSTGLMLLEMNTLFPDSPKLIIESDLYKAIDYGYKTYGFYDPKYFEFLQKRMDSIKGLRIAFDDIDDNLETIWNYLIGTPFNQKRADILKKMRIEIKDPFDLDREAMTVLFNNEITKVWNFAS
jgi:hypothetical protein